MSFLVVPLKDFLRKWNDFFFHQPVPRYKDLFVKAFGLIYLVYYFERLINFPLYFSPEGMFFIRRSYTYKLVEDLPPELLYGALVLSVMLGFSWCFRVPGIWTKLSLYVLHLFFNKLNLFVTYDADAYVSMFLFYSLFIDFRRDEALKSKLAFQCLKFHFSFTYFNSGLAKLGGLSWILGDAVYLAIHTHNPGNFLEILQHFPVLLTIITHSVVLLEILGPFFIWGRYANLIVVAFILLHLGIMVSMGLYGFSLICCCGLILFIKPQESSQRPDIYPTH